MSQLVTDYLDTLARPTAEGDPAAYAPQVRALFGLLAELPPDTDYREAYHRHIEEKYGVAAPASPPDAK